MDGIDMLNLIVIVVILLYFLYYGVSIVGYGWCLVF